AAWRWDTDVVVVGSGAGGGVAAAVLAQAGLDVVVLEKGRHLAERDFTHHEGQAHRDLYQDGTLGATDDLGVALLAGSCVGGGTTVNYCTSFATPAAVREEWDRVAGFQDVFTGDDFEVATKTVEDRIHVTTAESTPSRRDRIMQAGLEAIGLGAEVIPRDVEDCPQDDQCGSCLMGCRRRAKNGTAVTWLVDAAQAGARIAAGASVDRVLIEGGRAVGVEATLAGRPLTVRARAVVLACGALNTPGVLQRSGVRRKAVGANLFLHPVTAVWGRFSEPVRPWAGVAQARYADTSADLDGQGYGYRLETAPIHPALPGALLGWDGAGAFRKRLSQLPYLAPLGILLRDRDPGRALVRGDGRPYWRYRLSPRDQAHLRAGVHRGAEVLAAAGAEEIFASTAVPLSWNGDSGEPLPAFLERVDAAGYGPNRTTYVSFHQMGTARMGADRKRAVVDAENRVHGVSGLYVMDASCFPTSSGVNPMVTIEAIAHRGASILAALLA
ncbi:MAG TPA: GMC family oxidoreductase, partial [Actinomycetota bacterium]